MPYQRELDFFCRMMESLHIGTLRFNKTQPPAIMQNMTLHEELFKEISGMFLSVRERTLFCVSNIFRLHYHYLLLPGTEDVLLIGPYMCGEPSDEELLAMLERFGVAPGALSLLRRTFDTLPQTESGDIITAMCSALCEALYGGPDAYEIELMGEKSAIAPIAHIPPEKASLLSEAVSLRVLEERYDGERRLMHLVSLGHTHRAQMMIRQMNESKLESRAAEPLRSIKNYGIVLHTLLRKSAESGGVHPLYIDRLSSDLARRLENCRTTQECLNLFSSMVHKYCLLVRNHAMKNYSKLVQHVILRIDADLTADLGLKAHAQALNVNPSYLSALFRKETGQTLTDYVAHKRIDYAIFLLNSTDMQIQAIAQYCGIPDVNYFTKTFKRIIGKTPKGYRLDVRSEARRE